MRRRTLIMRLAIVLAVVGAAMWLASSSPSGRYVSFLHNVGGDCYFHFSHGTVSMVYWDGHTEQWGTYAKTKDGWLWTNGKEKGKPIAMRLRRTWAGVHIYDNNDPTKEVEFLRRRIVPFITPNWVADYLPEAIPTR